MLRFHPLLVWVAYVAVFKFINLFIETTLWQSKWFVALDKLKAKTDNICNMHYHVTFLWVGLFLKLF